MTHGDFLQLLRNLDWTRFLRAFVFADISTLVIPAWELALQLSGAAQESPALENLRQLSMEARWEMQTLVDDAAGPTGA